MHPIHLPAISRPKSILVATDLNDLDFLLPVAIDQARATGAMLWLLHVIPPEAYLSTQTGAFPLLQKKAFHDAEAALARVSFELKTMNVACAYEVHRWYPCDRINQFIREHQIKRLIVGTSRRGKFGKLLVGSVAEALIRSLDIPVCTVGPHFKPVQQSKPRRVIYATSLRHDFERSFQFAADLVTVLPSELTVLHVMEQDHLDDGIDLRAMSKIDEMLKGAKQMELVPQIRIRYGEPAEEIVSECSALKPELLVLGAVSASPMAANFRTGVAYRVIAQAPCPTFTLRNGPKEKHNGNNRKVSAVQTVS
jgi:nucleotide-binding universal stress UspA family protein